MGDTPSGGDARNLSAAIGQAVDAASRAAPDVRPRTSASGEIDQAVVAFNVFDRLLESDGVRAALYSLLRRTDYRFLSIFRFQDGRATSAVHVDRENLGATQAGEVDDTATYCSFVRRLGTPFATVDAAADPRTAAHVARDTVRSYCGVPIVDAAGRFVGTLCHYDLEPRDPAQLDAELLERVVRRLVGADAIPPYPEL